MIVGLDVGGTNARGMLIDPDSLSIVGQERASSAGDGAVLVETLRGLVERLVGDEHPTAVGLGVAGLAQRSGTVRYSPNLPDLIEYPLGPALAEATGVPVATLNDASAVALAEARLGAGRGADDFVSITLGTGIGAGVVVDGSLAQGAFGFAGEVGHMVVEVEGPTHHTGQRGPWEYYASGSALGAQGRAAAAAGEFAAGVALAGSVDAITGFEVAEALRAGDDDAARIFDGFCRWVAVGCANLVMIMDPQRIVIGGGLSGIGQPLAGGVASWMPEVTLGSAHRPPVEIRMAELGDEAGALGAGLFALESLPAD